MIEKEIWNKVLNKLTQEISYSNYKIFFEKTRLAEIRDTDSGCKAIIITNNGFVKQNLEDKYLPQIAEAILTVYGRKPIVKVRVGEIDNGKKGKRAGTDKASGTGLASLFDSEIESQVEKNNRNRLFKLSLSKSRLMEEYSFENFAVSPTNEVAYAAALAVAKDPGRAYNPLFLYGDVGVGKTHLMQAIGMRVLQNRPETKLIYCMGEQFTNEIIDAIRGKKTPAFRAKYREVEMLFIDDIQFIAGKNTVQEEFFHTFNSITSMGGQVVLTSDRPPHEIKLLEDRLRSRFEAGLTIDIQAPNFELRTAILLIKAKQMGRNLPMDVAQTIASHISSTRKLQGVLSQIYAVAKFKDRQVTPEFALNIIRKQNIGEEVPSQKNYVSPKDVINVISRHFNVSPKLLYGPKRNKSIVVPRQYAMYLLKTDLDIPLIEIGRIFGGRDHSTVIHSVEKISKMVLESEEMRKEFSTLKKEIYG